MLEEILNRYIVLHEDTNEIRIAAYKKYLEETDYAIIKLYETVVQGGSIIEMLREYKEVLANRKEAREKINELEIKE